MDSSQLQVIGILLAAGHSRRFGIHNKLLPDCLAQPYIEQCRLVSVLEQFVPPREIYVYRLQRAARIRIVYDQILQAVANI